MKLDIEAIRSTTSTVTSIIDHLRTLLGGMHPDFTFAWENGGWDDLLVVRFLGTEAISTPYRYEIDLLRRGHNSLDLDDFIGAHACLRIATLSSPGYRIVHGLITEAEELSSVPEGQLYRIVLEPPLALAERITRSRSFVDKTLRQIIDTVLSPLLHRADGAHTHGDDDHPHGYSPAKSEYCYRITDTTRIDDRMARAFCVQYNESDFSFLSRLLEEEGISYHFEHGPQSCLLVLSDADEGKTPLSPFFSLGQGKHGRDVSSFHLGKRLREKAVKIVDFDWRKPQLPLRAEAGRDAKLFQHRFPGYFQDRTALGTLLVKAQVERLATEASYATGSGGARVLSAGAIFQYDDFGSRHEGEYLTTKIQVRGEQSGVVSQASDHAPEPFAIRFELVRRGKGSHVEPSRFRPECRTPKPRIVGTQTAFVTDEPGARGVEVHVGGPKDAEIGCVRVRFHWDEDTARHEKEPTSCWVRVSQIVAGAGRGALFHPRVGDEVIVDFLEGDPDRPIVTGSVYNGANRPPADAKGAATVSAIRSLATPGGGVKNELAFDDTKDREVLSLHAGRNMATHAGNDRTETVTNNASSRVGVDRSEITGANRATDVGGDNAEHVAGNETLGVDANQSITIGANQSFVVGADRSVFVGANETKSVAAAQSITVSASRSVSVGADQSRNVGGSMTDTIGGSASLGIGGSRSISVAGNQDANIGGDYGGAVGGSANQAIGGAFGLNIGASMEAGIAANAVLATGANIALSAGGTMALVAQGESGVQAPGLSIVGLAELVLCVGGSSIRMTPGSIELASPCVKISGGATNVTGGLLNLN